MKKKKVFFILSSFRAGGAERVFWLLSQNFDKSLYDVSVVVLSTRNSFFSTNLDGVRLVDLNTLKASKSFLKLFHLLNVEKPDVIFTTGGQISTLVGLISLFTKIPLLIARPTNQDNSDFLSFKARMLGFFFRKLNKRFDIVVCQSEEIKEFVLNKQGISVEKLVVIPNPVITNNINRNLTFSVGEKRLIVVARLTPQKGIIRLLDIIGNLPSNYHLTIVGDGFLKNEIARHIIKLNLTNRVKMLGLINNVLKVISEHDIFVLPSYIEGFPNVIIESLSVGTPVVSFNVSGISEIIIENFNGYIVQQNDTQVFKEKIIQAAGNKWQSESIRQDVFNRFSLDKITGTYQNLIS